MAHEGWTVEIPDPKDVEHIILVGHWNPGWDKTPKVWGKLMHFLKTTPNNRQFSKDVKAILANTAPQKNKPYQQQAFEKLDYEPSLVPLNIAGH